MAIKKAKKRKVPKTARNEKPHKVTPATARRIRAELRRR